MTGLCSLALFALQSTAGLPPGTEVDALLRFGVVGTYQPKSQTLAAEGADTYVISTATSYGMRSWTRSRLDAGGGVVWTHTDYQTALGTTSWLVAGLASKAHVAPNAGLLISAQVDGRGDGVYRILAHSLLDGTEVWEFDPNANSLQIPANANARLLVDDSAGLLYQVLILNGELVVRRIDLQTGALTSTGTFLGEFDDVSLYDVELSADGQRLYFAGTASQLQFFLTVTHGIAVGLDLGTGAELWRTLDADRTTAEVEERPGSAEVALLAYDYQGDTRLWAVDGTTGSEVWSQTNPAPAALAAEMEYTPDGTGLVVASGQPFDPGPIPTWQPGGVLGRFDSSDGSLLWQRNIIPAGVDDSFAAQPIELAVHPDGTALWSYTSSYNPPLEPVETVTLEGVDLGSGTLLFDEVLPGRNYARLQAVDGTAEFALIHTDPIDPLDDAVREPTVRRMIASTGVYTFGHQPERSGPVRTFAVNFEVTDDATRAAMMRYVHDQEPRLELLWIDLGSGQTLWSDVLPATTGLNIAEDFNDRNREMLLSPDESVLVSVVRGDGGAPYKLRLRAYEVATGQLLWSETFDKQKGASLFYDGLTRPGNRSVEVTNDEVLLAGNINQVGGMLLASRDLWTGAANWTLNSESGTSNYPYSTHVALAGDDLYAFVEAPVGAVAAPGKRIVRFDRATGAILGFREVDTNGFLTRLYAKGGGEPLLVSDNTVTGTPTVFNTRLLQQDLTAELGLFAGDYDGVPLAPGEGYLVAGDYQVGDTVAAGEVHVDVPLLSSLEPAPGGAPSFLEVLDRGQLLFDIGDTDPSTGLPGSYVRFWDATDGAFMWGGLLFAGTDWEIGGIEHLEQLPGRAGFVASEGPTTAEVPAADTRAPAPVVQVLDLPELVVEPTEVSLSGGAQLDYWLRRNTEAAGPQAYFLVGGLDEVNDGPVIDGIQMPFAATDAYTLLTLTQANQANFVDTLGVLDEFGNARAQINSPAGLDPALAGETFHYAWLTIDLAPFALITDVSHTVQTFKLP